MNIKLWTKIIEVNTNLEWEIFDRIE